MIWLVEGAVTVVLNIPALTIPSFDSVTLDTTEEFDTVFIRFSTNAVVRGMTGASVGA